MSVAKKHYAWIIIAAVLVLGGGYMLYKYLKKPKAVTLPDHTSKPKVSATTALTTGFPIKQGSTGTMVKQLQSYLGVTVDGIWGPKTQAAFVAQTGKTQIASQTELTDVLNQLASTVSPSSKADMIYNNWTDSDSALIPLSDVIAYGVTEDLDGNLTLTGQQVTWPANQALSRDSYVPVDTTVNGYLEVAVSDGVNSSLYKVDPANMGLTTGGTTSTTNYLSTLLSSLNG